jgi:chromosome partitioning protein
MPQLATKEHMTAKIVTVINQKGGSGKTNVAMTLAASFGARGFGTLVVDGDRQGTATKWYAGVPEDKTFPAKVINLSQAGGAIGRAMKDHVGAYDIVIVDTPGSISDGVPLATMLLADLAIVPMIPAPGDLWATTELLELVKQAQGINGSLDVRVVPNMVVATNLADSALAALKQVGLPLTASFLTTRNVYRLAMAEGTSVLGLKDAKAIEESECLADEVLELLGLPKKKKPAARAKNA